jgi:dTDP-4-dehydrorhamnose reductase
MTGNSGAREAEVGIAVPIWLPGQRTASADLAQAEMVRATVRQYAPDIIVNAAAYTAVDRAESDTETAYAVNTEALHVLGDEAARSGACVIHYSTDYVFDGLKKDAYIETDSTNPQSVYGKTKCEGETKVRAHTKHIILRTSWVFGSHGSNFLKTILRLIHEKESLNIVNDQWGSPASSATLADVTFKIIDTIIKNKNFNDYGTYHVTNEGETNWHQYASLIANETIRLGFKIKCEANQIRPISTSEFPTTARRPLNSRLNTNKLKKTFMLELPHWELEVKNVLREII